MGQAQKQKCLSCSNIWKHYAGSGFNKIYYYCDKCGGKQSFKWNDNDGMVVDLSNESDPCKCGGTYRMNNDPIICPECHSKDTEADQDIIINWD